MSFCRISSVQYNYSVNGKALSRSNTITDLGVIFNSKFTFHEHIYSITSRALKTLGFVKRNSAYFTNIKTLIRLYKSIVRPILEYVSILWCPWQQFLIKQIETIQKRFLSYLYFKQFGCYNRMLSSVTLNNMYNFDSLNRRRDVASVLYLYKIINNQIDDSQFHSVLRFSVPRPGLRSNNIFDLPTVQTVYMCNSPVQRMCNICNIYAKKYNIDFFNDSFRQIKSKINN